MKTDQPVAVSQAIAFLHDRLPLSLSSRLTATDDRFLAITMIEFARHRLATRDGAVERLRTLLHESLYHLRLDDAAKAYHDKVNALLAEPAEGEGK